MTQGKNLVCLFEPFVCVYFHFLLLLNFQCLLDPFSTFQVFEPSELERGHFTELDNEIRTTDMPERFQVM